MTGWRHLSAFVRELRGASVRIPPDLAGHDLRVRAAATAMAEYGVETCTAQPTLVNVAALALSLEQLVVHVLAPEIPELVDETDLHALPDAPPRLLARPWIVEVRHPERGERLFRDVAALGGYAIDGRVCLLGLSYPDGARTAWWTPRWTGEDLAEGVVPDSSPLIDDVDVHEAWTREAARFAVVLGVLLDAEGAPTRVLDESDRRKVSPGRSKKLKPPPAWVTRYVTIAPETPRPDGPAEPASAAAAAPVAEGRLAERRPVRGHVKRQRYGPGNGLVKWIYVPRYSARRWIAPGDRRVVVGV